MHVLWLIPEYESFLVEELIALAPRVQRLSVISQASPVQVPGASSIQVPRTQNSLGAAVRRIARVSSASRSLPWPRSIADGRSFYRAVRKSEFIEQYVRDERVDLIHSHFAYPLGTAGTLFTNGIPVVLTLRGVDILVSEELEYGYCRDPYYRRKLNRALRRASAVTVASSVSEQALASQFEMPSRPFVIPNGVDLTRFSPHASDPKIRTELGTGSRPMILSVGRLVPLKGFDTLLDAMRIVVEIHPQVVLVIAGEGPERHALETQIAQHGLGDNVVLPGRLGRSAIAACYADCTMFVHPSRLDGFGNVVLEAMASGAPVVGTRETGSIRDYIRHGENGLAVSAGDSHDLASAILYFLDHPDVARSCGTSARDLVISQNFSMDDRVAQFVSLYEMLYQAGATTR